MPSPTDSQAPLDLVQAASRRLSLTAALVAAVYTVYEVLFHTLWSDVVNDVGRNVGFAVIAVSVLVAWQTPRVLPTQVAYLGIGYETLVCAALETAQFSGLRSTAVATGVSWSVAVILFFPMLLPAAPRLTLAGSLLAASMGPLGYLVGRALGGPPLNDVGVLVSHWLPTYICAVLTWVPASVIHRLGVDVKRARRLGSYELLEKLGEGGMGEVYRARHTLLARPAAIKLIRPDANDSKKLESRFRREALATAKLQSPHTVQLYDFGVSRQHEFYYVMELLRGIDLEALVQRFGPLPAPRVVFLLLQICDSLEEAHQAGMVHRDIKPQNLYVTKSGQHFDFVKVLDFGLVKLLGDQLQEAEVSASTESKVLGTPAYLPPELTMDTAQVDGRTDLYALGCVAYFLLTGSLVFQAPSPIKMVVAHATEPPPRLSDHVPAPIDEELEDAIMQCLEKDVTKRPASAAHLARRLEATGLAAKWPPELQLAWWREHLPELLVGGAQTSDHPRAAPAAYVEPVAASSAASNDSAEL